MVSSVPAGISLQVTKATYGIFTYDRPLVTRSVTFIMYEILLTIGIVSYTTEKTAMFGLQE